MGSVSDEPSIENLDSTYQVSFFAGTGDATTEVRVGPNTKLWRGPEDSVDSPVHTLGLSFPQTATRSVTANHLVTAALAECGVPLDKITRDEFPDAFTFYHIKDLLANPSCDGYLAAQQQLACAADKLAELAEAEGPVVWSVSVGVTAALELPSGPYTFPPQKPEARFMIRDAAIATLAHIAWLDMAPMVGANGGTSCTDAYQFAVNQASKVDATQVFGMARGAVPSPKLPGLIPARPIATDDDVRELATSRLQLKAHVLRAAARLLPDLVSDSVYADLAGAASKASAQGDFGRAAATLWGNRGRGYYNTIAHAARVVGQRWQSPVSWLPAWQGLKPSLCVNLSLSQDALEQAYGDDYSARTTSLPATTNSQSQAVGLLEDAGVVFDEEALKQPIWLLQSQVIRQLMFAGAKEHGIHEREYVLTPQGAGIRRRFDTVSDADFLFAAKTVQDRYRVLTGAKSSGWNAALTATANQAADRIAPSNPPGMLVFANGLPKSDLTQDVLAKMGGFQALSQCTESIPGAKTMGTDFATGFSVQDSFAIGQALYSRLVALREVTKSTPSASQTTKVAEAASAELRAWSGEGRVFAVGRSPIALPNVLRTIELTTLGFEPENFGAVKASEMKERVVLVWGTAQTAMCAAGLATACPADLDSYIARPVASDVRKMWPGENATVPVPNDANVLEEKPLDQARRFYGTDGTWGSFKFIAGAANFRPRFAGTGVERERLYVVVRGAGAALAGSGQVLGALSLRSSGGYTSLVVSKEQRRLYNEIFGLDRAGLTHRNMVGLRSLAKPKSYCLPGVAYDSFVPLENELTSDGDGYESSWKTLLSQAKSAAERADALGDKMLDWGLQQELRREAANEQLGEICGTYGMVDEGTFQDGKIKAGASDGPLGNCLNGRMLDIVFLGKMPEDLRTSTDPQTFLRDKVLSCDDANGTGVTNRSGLCDHKEPLSYAELQLKDVPANPTSESNCNQVYSLADSLRTGFSADTLAGISQPTWLQSERLSALTSALQYVEDAAPGSTSKQWYVTWNRAITIMSSTGRPRGEPGAAPSVWPGCLLHGTCQKQGLQARFQRIFGTYDGLSGDELMDEIGWRVQGALWTLGVLSQGRVVGRNLFDVQVPVAAFDSDASDAGARLVPAIYGDGQMLYDTSSGRYKLKDGPIVPPEVAKQLDRAVPFSAGYRYPAQGSPELYPPWLRSFWSVVAASNRTQPTAYLTTAASSADYALMQETAITGDTMRRVGESFRNIRCEGKLFHEQVGSTGSDLSEGIRLWGDLKTGREGSDDRVRWANVCPRPGHGGKRGILQLTPGNDGELAVQFRDVILAGKCNENPYLYGYSGELLPIGTPQLRDRHWWYVWHGNACVQRSGGNASVSTNCLNQWDVAPLGDLTAECHFSGKYAPWSAYGLGRWALRPDNCSKENRARLFINQYAPRTACDTAAELVAALGMACELENAPAPANLSKPPPIRNLDDLPMLGAWIEELGKQMANQAGRMWAENVPESVLKDFTNGTVATGSNAGESGRARIALGQNLSDLRTHWRHVGETISLVGFDIKNAKISKDMAQNEANQAAIEMEIRQAESLARLGSAVAQANGASTDALFEPTKAGSAGAAIVIAGIEAARHFYVTQRLGRIEDLQGEQYENSLAKILNDLHATLDTRMSTIGDHLAGLEGALAGAKSSASELEQLMNRANHAAALASGDSFYKDANGNVVEVPVNTILNRQYDTTRKRYRNALQQARTLAFLSRLAIEQRIGERLDAVSFPTSIGPIPSPGLWADDVCHMSGIDFDKYKDAPLPEWAKEKPSDQAETVKLNPSLLEASARRNLLAYFKKTGTMDDLSKQYIGDYVASLEAFMTHYNTEFPAHDGDDTTVLSLRNDLMVPSHLCSEPTANLLTFSDELGRNVSHGSTAASEVKGWQVTDCDLAVHKCLVVAKSSEPGPVGDMPVNWVVEKPLQMSVAVDTDQATESDDEEPRSTRELVQKLVVEPGSYIVSWWDKHLDETGKSTASPSSSTLQVLVTDNTGLPLAGWQGMPSADWSERRSIGFSTSRRTTIRLGMRVSLLGEGVGSAGIAGVQLEKVVSKDASPSAYEQTRSLAQTLRGTCPPNPEQFRREFVRGQDEHGRVYYELRRPVVINTDLLSDPNVLHGKLAQDNFNYRYVNLAVNLVGNGIVDCTGASAGCHDTASVDYSLAHNALNIELRGVGGKLRSFNFGEAFIHDGRALATDIEVQVPVSAEYGALLHQEGVTKTELMGRPLDGLYRLRIWERPGLEWDRLTDVQLVVKYRYWSAIHVDGAGGW